MADGPRLYTRGGDDGTTGLVGGQRAPKTDARIEAYGDVDELNSVLGLVRAEAEGPETADLNRDLGRVQHQLFNLGSLLATLPEDRSHAMPAVGGREVDWLEHRIDAATAEVPPLRNFVLPGGSRLNATLHLARTVCRRAERRVVTLHDAGGCTDAEVRYLNRLSDALFAWARLAAVRLGHDEVAWDKDGG